MPSLVTAEEMRAAEAEAGTRGLSSEALMQLAGRGAAQAILERPEALSRRYLLLVGPGNNGGDTLVVAALLHRAGAQTQIVTYRRQGQLSESRWDAIPHFDTADDPKGGRLQAALHDCDLVIDGLLGTGRSRPIGPDLAALLQAVNEARDRITIVALDLPTGVDADCGSADAAALRAHETLAFGYVKRGLRLYPARGHCGIVRLIDIGLPMSANPVPDASEPEISDVAGWLPQRPPTVQKYSAGAVLALAGSRRYVGAPILCCLAAMRAGAGYVTLAIDEAIVPTIAARLLEPTLLPLPRAHDQGVGLEAIPQLQEIAGRYAALVVGPGLGRTPATTSVVLAILSGALQGPRAAVVDADALFALAENPDWPQLLRLPIVLTPHSGEMARMTNLHSKEIEADRCGVAQRFAKQWGQVLVLKGAPTIVAAPWGALSVNPTGNPLLATAGTGDVLAGVIGAFLAGGADPYNAARAGVYIHGLAADLAVPTFGDRGMVASDLLPLLPQALQQVLRSCMSLN